MRCLAWLATIVAGFMIAGGLTAAHAASATIQWTSVPGSVAGYRMHYATSSGPPYTHSGSPVDIPISAIADPANPSYTLSGLPTCEHLFFACTAYYTDGTESPFSPEYEITMVAAPKDVTATPAAAGAVVVEWATDLAPDDAGSVASYRVHYSLTPVADGGVYSGTGAVQGDSPLTAASQLTLSGLAPGQTIYVAVEAVCASGETSQMSDQLSVVVPDAICNNSIVETNETCDPPSSCPSCNDGIACTADSTTGSADSCNVSCGHTMITACAGGDGCCPSGCDSTTDGDCSPSCGNDVVEPGETCDPPLSCPSSCDDGIACTADTLTGSATNCSVSCSHAAITACAGGDGCCPPGCDSTTDLDCSVSCGNNTIEEGETCDPPSSCPASCDDGIACTVDNLTGSATSCSVSCSHGAITACAGGDGCCPPGCDATSDTDCSPTCGNGLIEAGETCDPPESCPVRCDDDDACTADIRVGSKLNCSSECSNTPITACGGDDGCCPAGCNPLNDADCGANAPGGGSPNFAGPTKVVGGCSVTGDRGGSLIGLGCLLLLGLLRRRRR